MSSLNHVDVLGGLFSEYWRHLEDTLSAAELKEWSTSSASASTSGNTGASPLLLPPLNWTGMAAQFYAKTGMLLLPEHLVDCYLAVLNGQCGGEVKELHRLFAGPDVRSTSRGSSRATKAEGGGVSPPPTTVAGRRSSGPHAGGATPPSGSLRGAGTSPTHIAVDDTRGFVEDGDPMSPLGRRDRGSSFTALGSRSDLHERVSRGGETSGHTESSGGDGNGSRRGDVTRTADPGSSLTGTVDDEEGLFHCNAPQWVRGLSAEEQQRLQRLRHETPLSPEILAQLLEQLSLVEGAPLFMNEVQPQTMMMYNGVSAGPYKHVIRKPMSLAVMKANVAESRRQYHLRTTVSEAADVSDDTERRGVKRQRGSGGGAVGGGPAPGPSGGAGTANAAEGATANEMALSENGSLNRVLTLADVERAVWQTAANCAMFNAPESDYPFSARRFAVGCMKVLEEYCRQQLLVD